jgi:hypothetical protein
MEIRERAFLPGARDFAVVPAKEEDLARRIMDIIFEVE